MRARVVFESMFGNTQVIAQAVADGLAESMSVELEEVGSAATEIAGDVDLLVVGGPTHAFGMSRQRTRESAVSRLWEASCRPGGTTRMAQCRDRRLARYRGCCIRHAHRQASDAGIGRPWSREAPAADGLPRARPSRQLLCHRHFGPTGGR